MVEQIKNKRLEKPQLSVLVSGDKNVRYLFIMDVLALLSESGIVGVGLMTKSIDEQVVY